MAEISYVTDSAERKVLGVSLVVVASVLFIVTYICGCLGFTIFVTALAGCLVLFYPVHNNLLRLEGRAVLITGCDTGFGHELAKRLDEKGCTVYAGCLFGDGEGAKKLRESGSVRLHVVPLDVTSDASVEKAVEYVTSKTGALWAVMNNAGINYLGDADIVTMDTFRRVGDINLYGAVRVTKAFLPLLKKSKGRVINVTSVKGLVAFPICSHYNITKFGLEAFSDCLRMEMRRFGVHVVVVEPSNFGGITAGLMPAERDYNDIWDKMSKLQREEYGREYIDRQIDGAKASAKTTHPNMNPVVDDMVEAIASQNPKYRYLIGGGNGAYDFYKWLAVFIPFIPTNIKDWYIERIFNLPTPQVLQGKK